MTVQVFRSTDTGAPVLSNVAGAFITVLDKCLWQGYNSQTATSITRVGNVATVTKAAHGFILGQYISHSGAAQADYNVSAFITNVTANTYDYNVANNPVTPATGTITISIAGAGWSKEYAGTNKASYRQPAGSNRMYLDVDDTSTNGARLRGSEVLNSCLIGSAQFPTEAQFPGGLYYNKSSGGVSPWTIISNGKTIIIFTQYGASVIINVFGDIESYRAGDQYNTILISGADVVVGSSNNPTFHTLGQWNATQPGHYIARQHNALGGSTLIGKFGDAARGGSSLGSSGGAYPNPIDGGLHMSRIYIGEPTATRGYIPGIWNPLHPQAFSHGDVVNGLGALAGKKFECFKFHPANQVFVETSNTW